MPEETWDRTVDVLVAGSGIGGLGSAAIAEDSGARVEVVEKAARVGGTTAKSAAYMWVPNNKFLRAGGHDDPREQALHYMAKLSRPRLYDPEHPTLGLPEWEYRGIAAFYDNASTAAEAYENLGILEFGHAADFPDYYSHIAEDARPTGRIIFPAESEGGPSGGRILIDKLQQHCERVGIAISTETAITSLVQDESGSVIGAVVEDQSRTVRIRTRRGVILATGGFTHDPDRRLRYLDQSYVGGCAARTNTGDILDIVRNAGADFANMNAGMRAPMVLERLVQDPATIRGSFMIPGDSMLIVNRFGDRVISEKTPYHDFARVFFDWDGKRAVYPNNPLIMIWDDAAARFGGDGFGNPIPAAHEDPYWVVTANTLAELESGLVKRLEQLRTMTGDATLDDDFQTTVHTTINRYNQMAESGVDDDFGRGSTPIEQALSAFFGVGDGPNPMMAPLSTDGPFHATILGPGLIDTAGGPRVDEYNRVVTSDDRPIPGLYAVGNCAATPSGEAYWAGGHTIGFIQSAAYVAGTHISQ